MNAPEAITGAAVAVVVLVLNGVVEEAAALACMDLTMVVTMITPMNTTTDLE
ncbi:hypothetical protein CONCODRAFT_80466 [Conidiobolus coronatus NRRL 28638]|uniref:Uncharacterized protein n=1 Tax=Conidiobolus coronatus (strain ATCC 28846 / CBS 209.66 / NRRL 28638) TaxID=796925 RepID=A0A137NUQ5_CONC2|nr:hypothetical protein CONCODRAFT_80466 [Conidiobolus coronatus NRRL 28638]|eukprot:KXN66533.1 hypothetical protein CONCODRAFT_80466 [Conidiobolus coronatus NRRL 28638]